LLKDDFTLNCEREVIWAFPAADVERQSAEHAGFQQHLWSRRRLSADGGKRAGHFSQRIQREYAEGPGATSRRDHGRGSVENKHSSDVESTKLRNHADCCFCESVGKCSYDGLGVGRSEFARLHGHSPSSIWYVMLPSRVQCLSSTPVFHTPMTLLQGQHGGRRDDAAHAQGVALQVEILEILESTVESAWSRLLKALLKPPGLDY